MPAQNMISETLDAKAKEDIIAKLNSIRESLPFLMDLDPEEIKEIFKAGHSYTPFLDMAYNTVKTNPSIMSGEFDMAEYKRDYELFKALDSIAKIINPLTEGINNTLIAVKSDTFTGSLEVYDETKKNADRIAGLRLTADEMGKYFKKVRKASSGTAK